VTYTAGVRLAILLAALLSAACATPSASSSATTSSRPLICDARVARLWHGRVLNARADEYDAYIREAIQKFRDIPGNLGYQLMRETIDEETHFSVISYWRSKDDITGYAGDNIRKVRSLPRDPEFLVEVEPTVFNYDLAVLDVGCSAGQ
jgi:heme-degrading monooxygenase HmoA